MCNNIFNATKVVNKKRSAIYACGRKIRFATKLKRFDESILNSFVIISSTRYDRQYFYSFNGVSKCDKNNFCSNSKGP